MLLDLDYCGHDAKVGVAARHSHLIRPTAGRSGSFSVEARVDAAILVAERERVATK